VRDHKSRALVPKLMSEKEAVEKFVADGDTLFLDSGSTSCFVAKALGEHRQLKIITNSLAVAQAVRKDRGHTLFLAGGELNAAYQAFSDRHAQDFLAGFRPSLSILTVGAVSLEHGLMDHSPGEAIMSRIAYSTASRVPLASTTASSVGSAWSDTAALKDVDVLVTDAPLTPAFQDAFSHAEVVIA